MAPFYFPKTDPKVTVISRLQCAKFSVNLINIYKVTSCKKQWPRFWPTL